MAIVGMGPFPQQIEFFPLKSFDQPEVKNSAEAEETVDKRQLALLTLTQSQLTEILYELKDPESQTSLFITDTMQMLLDEYSGLEPNEIVSGTDFESLFYSYSAALKLNSEQHVIREAVFGHILVVVVENILRDYRYNFRAGISTLLETVGTDITKIFKEYSTNEENTDYIPDWVWFMYGEIRDKLALPMNIKLSKKQISILLLMIAGVSLTAAAAALNWDKLPPGLLPDLAKNNSNDSDQNSCTIATSVDGTPITVPFTLGEWENFSKAYHSLAPDMDPVTFFKLLDSINNINHQTDLIPDDRILQAPQCGFDLSQQGSSGVVVGSSEQTIVQPGQQPLPTPIYTPVPERIQDISPGVLTHLLVNANLLTPEIQNEYLSMLNSIDPQIYKKLMDKIENRMFALQIFNSEEVHDTAEMNKAEAEEIMLFLNTQLWETVGEVNPQMLTNPELHRLYEQLNTLPQYKTTQLREMLLCNYLLAVLAGKEDPQRAAFEGPLFTSTLELNAGLSSENPATEESQIPGVIKIGLGILGIFIFKILFNHRIEVLEFFGILREYAEKDDEYAALLSQLLNGK